MIDISSAILDPELGSVSFTVERSVWKRDQGENVLLAKSTASAVGCIHPGTAETLSQLPEEDRHEEHIVIYTTYPLSLGQNDGITFTVPDRILWDNACWLVVRIKDWFSFGYGQALAVRAERGDGS